MGLFDFFRKNTQKQENTDTENTAATVKENDFIAKSELSEYKSPVYTVEFGTKLPIDIIYGLLNENYEEKGYKDALTNPDKSYKDKNIAIIRATVEIKIQQIMLKYEDMLRYITFHIKSRTDYGLMDIVELLTSKKEICEKHVAELEKMKQSIDNKDSFMAGIFLSYEVGFTRGLASLSLQNLKIDEL